MYADLLHAFQTTVSDPTKANTAETLMTAVLLGLYEVRMLEQWFRPPG